LIAIRSDDYSVVVAKSLAGTEYADLSGKGIRLPSADKRPSKAAFEHYRQNAGL
jgi:hypothetical protein